MSLDDSAAPDFPILDLGAFAAADAAGRAAIGAEVDRTCRETGFLAVGNHGVPDAVIANLWSKLTAFFDLPAEEKQRLKPAPGDIPTAISARGPRPWPNPAARTRPPT